VESTPEWTNDDWTICKEVIIKTAKEGIKRK
jgi:hypothetical protein